jgi:hypothetical protein
MTTLMKAPDIFAFIAALLLMLFIIFWGASTFGMARLLRGNSVVAASVKIEAKKINIKKTKKRKN